MSTRSLLAAALLATGCDDLCEDCKEAVCGVPGECLAGDEPLYPLSDGAWWRYRVTDDDEVKPDKIVSIQQMDAIRPLALDGTVEGHDLVLADRVAIPVFMALSDSEDEIGERWQTIDPTSGDVRRHVDAWYRSDRSGKFIQHYCPYKTRVADGPRGTCQNGCFEERYTTVVILAATSDWRSCWRVPVRAEDCSIAGTLPPGCIATPSREIETTRVDIVTTLDEACGDVEAAKVTTEERADGKADVKSEAFWWARGRGKLQEVSKQTEVLVQSCLPQAGCHAPVPTREEIEADEVEACVP